MRWSRNVFTVFSRLHDYRTAALVIEFRSVPDRFFYDWNTWNGNVSHFHRQGVLAVRHKIACNLLWPLRGMQSIIKLYLAEKLSPLLCNEDRDAGLIWQQSTFLQHWKGSPVKTPVNMKTVLGADQPTKRWVSYGKAPREAIMHDRSIDQEIRAVMHLHVLLWRRTFVVFGLHGGIQCAGALFPSIQRGLVSIRQARFDVWKAWWAWASSELLWIPVAARSAGLQSRIRFGVQDGPRQPAACAE